MAKYWLIDEEPYPAHRCMTPSGSVGWEPFAVAVIRTPKDGDTPWVYSKKQIEVPDVYDESGTLMCPFCKVKPFDELNGCRCYREDAAS